MALPKLKTYQKKFEHSYTYGIFPTLELLRNRPDNVLQVIFSEKIDSDDVRNEIESLCEEVGVPVSTNQNVIDKLSVKENTFVIGVFQKYVSNLDVDANHVVLHNPSNLGNIGTIARTMLGMGYQDLALIRPAADIFSPMVIRASMGAIFSLRFSHFDTLEEYFDFAKDRTNYLLVLDDQSTEIKKIAPGAKFSIVLGNEGKGLPEQYLDLGEKVFIEHASSIESYNLSIAASITMWELNKNS